MIEKVTVQMTDAAAFAVAEGRGCEAMRPKELLLYAAAQCAGHTALHIMQKERITPRRFEITYTGDVTGDDAQGPTLFRSFRVMYNVEVDSQDDQAKVGRAIRLTHDKYCALTQMLRKIAPVTDEIAVVSTEEATA